MGNGLRALTHFFRRARAIRIFAATVTAWLLSSAPAKAEIWHYASTNNFEIYSAGKEGELRKMAEKIERLDALLRMLYRLPGEPAENRLTVYLFDDAQDVRNTIGNSGNMLAGFYQSNIRGSYFVSNRERGSKYELGAQAVLFHEYTHHFMARYFRFAYPAWYREGFAEYFATATFDKKGKWTYGRPPRYRGYDLIRAEPIAIEKLLFAEPHELSGKEKLNLYARGWLLTHMMHADPQRDKSLLAYLRETGLGGDPRDAAAKHLGDLSILDDQLDEYVRQKIRFIEGFEPINYAGEIAIRRLDDVSAELVELRLANFRGRGSMEVRDALGELAAANPNRADVLIELAWAEYLVERNGNQDEEEDSEERGGDEDIEFAETGGGQFAAAHAALDRALVVEAESSGAHVLKGKLLMDAAETDEEFALARSHIVRANRAAPYRPYPLKLYYDSFVEASQPPPDDALQGLIRAFELAPEVVNLRIQLAFALANYGDYNSAINLMRILAGDPHNGHSAKQIIKQIEARRDGVSYIPAPEID